MADPRLADYASLLVDRCIDVQPGWQVLVRATPPARPLVEEVVAAIARRGAYALPRLSFSGRSPWVAEAPEELLGARSGDRRPRARQRATASWSSTPRRTPGKGRTSRPSASCCGGRRTGRTAEPFFAGEKPWVGCQFPTPALAQDAGMGLRAYEDFLYGAVLVDWDALAERMREIAAHFDAGRRGAGHRRRHRPHLQPRGPLRPRGRDRREHARRRGLLQPGRGLGAGHGRLLRVPGVLRRPRRSRTSGSASRAAAPSTRRPRPTRTSC